jgi:hypothetical protein
VRAIIVFLGMLALLLSACQNRGPLRQVTKGDEIAYYAFNAPGSFEEGTYGLATLRVTGGVYRIDVQQGDNTLWWGQWGDTYSDAVIDVDVEQTTERNENAFGVMCRVRGSVGQARTPDPDLAAIMEATQAVEATAEASSTEESTATEIAEEPNLEATEAVDAVTAEPSMGEGDGYLFLIQGTGSYSIMRARGRNVMPLVNWTTSDQINVGPGRNHLRAICQGNYLALYINDQFMADTTDDTYTSGQVGLVASAANRLGLRVEFDDLSISEARTG